MAKIQVVGVDIFVIHKGVPAVKDTYGSLKPVTITNRGAKVWPGKVPPLDMTDSFCIRFKGARSDDQEVTSEEIIALLKDLESTGLQWNHVEKLLVIDGKIGFT